jgi:flavorubredoxin
MKAVVVYESHWGNTAAVAKAIAEGIGPDTRVLPTDQADAAAIDDLDLLVVGAPVMAFGLPTERMEASVAAGAAQAPTPPDVSHPSIRTWLDDLPRGHAEAAAFETRVRWSPGGATGSIERGLERAGYRTTANSGKFIVTGRYGPLRAGELERARDWGARLRTRLPGG